jgi:hypothetical protein
MKTGEGLDRVLAWLEEQIAKGLTAPARPEKRSHSHSHVHSH